MEKEIHIHLPIPSKLALSLFFLFLFLSMFSATEAQNTTIPEKVNVNVGVVLNLERLGGKIWLSCINMALSDFYASNDHYKTRLLLHSRDSKIDVIGAAAQAIDLIKHAEVEAIMGPESSMQANFIIDLGEAAHVPIVTFSATSPSLTSIRSEYFIRATQNDSSQVKSISALVQAFGWRQAVPIYVDNQFGEGIIPYLTDALQEVDTQVPYRCAIHLNSSDDEIGKELYKLMTMQTRVFIVHMLPSLAARVFSKAKEIGMMKEGYVWILTDGIADELSSIGSTVIDSMQGVLGIKTHVPDSEELESFRGRWKMKFQQDNPIISDAKLDIFGLWAHDAAVALAMAVEKAGITNSSFHKTNDSSSASDLEIFGVSQNGPKLLQSLSSSNFRGLTGDFRFVNGQLQSSTFQIVNINGNGWRRIGFWTPQSGLVNNLSLADTSTYSTSKANLGPVIWPGESTSVPKGWEIPTNEKKLRIGVPRKDGFSEFVKVTRNNITNATTATGFCIEVFNAVMQELPYVVPYEFIPFEKPNGEMAGTYNDLVYQVFLQKFDAVVGDITIIANRSNYVDFTLPYTESGVSMVVPVKDKKEKNAWVFLKPLTWDLWAASACFFVFIGFIVWVLEHRINPEFRGPLSHQIGTSFWFSFSTMVFAHRERVVSNLGRFVVIVWCFVVLTLTQSYTASLASLLTVQQLQPTVTDVHKLIKNGDNVGYKQGSWVFGILKNMGFNETKLQIYRSPEEWDDLLSKGSAKGGIAAAFDEVPYIKLFLAQYCSKYTMVEPTFHTGGFGFVFPKGSPLVADVSRAILNVTQGDKMKGIENAWFGPNTMNCPDPSTLILSNSLGLESFWGLFLIAGVASFLALIISTAMFLYEHRDVLMHFDPETSIWSRMAVLFRKFDDKDYRSHTFRNSQVQGTNGMFAVGASPASYFPTTPSSHRDSPAACAGFDDPNLGGEASTSESAIELTSPNQERPMLRVEIVHDNN